MGESCTVPSMGTPFRPATDHAPTPDEHDVCQGLRGARAEEDSDRREAAIAKRLDRIVRVLERLERNDGVTLETIALFIRFWLTSTPALPEQSSPAARAKGAERYDRFVEALGRRLSSGSTVLKEVSIESPEVGNAAQVKGQADSQRG